MTKNIELQPVNKNMSFDEDCWLIINTNSKDSTTASFYNPKQAEDYETFEEFVECTFDNEFFMQGKSTKIMKENFAEMSAAKSYVDDDYDEDSGKSFECVVAEAQIIQVFKGAKMEDVPNLVKKIEKDLASLEKEEIFKANDSIAFNKNPYAYHGVSKKDFF